MQMLRLRHENQQKLYLLKMPSVSVIITIFTSFHVLYPLFEKIVVFKTIFLTFLRHNLCHNEEICHPGIPFWRIGLQIGRYFGKVHA